MLAVVDAEALALERVGGAAQLRPDLDERDVGAGVGSIKRGGDAREAPADHHDALPAHAPTPARLRAATHAFSQVGTDMRRSRTSSGCFSIRVRSRR